MIRNRNLVGFLQVDVEIESQSVPPPSPVIGQEVGAARPRQQPLQVGVRLPVLTQLLEASTLLDLDF